MAIFNNFPMIAQRFLNVPLMLQPTHAKILAASMGMPYDYGEEVDDLRKPYKVINGVAIIEVQGLLIQKLGVCYPIWGMTGYDGIRACFIDAFHDDTVKAIVLDIDSPGGEVAGAFDLADMIFSARGKKPIWSVLNENGYSSAYLIASAADKVVLPRTGGTGSIGVIVILSEITRALNAAGVTINVLQFGARKADGYPVVKLSNEARAKFQKDVYRVGNLFTNTVARNRKLSVAKVLAQQAGCFISSEAVTNRLADAVLSPDAALDQLTTIISRRPPAAAKQVRF